MGALPNPHSGEHISEIDVQGFERRFQRALENLKGAKDVSERNKSTILKFIDLGLAEGLSKGRLVKYAYNLGAIARWLGKDFESANREDIEKVARSLESKDYSEWTKVDFKAVLKKFYRWLRKTDDHYPEEVRWIKTTLKASKQKLPTELLTEEEVTKLVETADNLRDKALILTLYESGCRIGEIASLKLKNVDSDNHGTVLIVSGKTGSRRVRLVNASPLLATWRDNHPDRGNPEAPLWVGIGPRNKNKMISYNSICIMIRRVAKKAGIKKRVHPHLFRHSRATLLAKYLTEAQLKQIFGWTQSSSMAATYVHLSGRDVDDAILRLHGIKSEEKAEVKMKPKKCPRCGFVNSSVAEFCNKCDFALDVEAAIRLDSERKKEDLALFRVLSDPEIQKFIARKIVEKGLTKEVRELLE